MSLLVAGVAVGHLLPDRLRGSDHAGATVDTMGKLLCGPLCKSEDDLLELCLPPQSAKVALSRRSWSDMLPTEGEGLGTALMSAVSESLCSERISWSAKLPTVEPGAVLNSAESKAGEPTPYFFLQLAASS